MLAASVCLIAGNAQASFQYNYLEAVYLFGEYEFANSDVDITGYEITAQFDLSPSFALGVSYTSLEGDDVVTSIDGVNSLSFDSSGPDVYALYHSPVGEQTDFILGASIDMRDIEAAVQGQTPSLSKDEDTKYLFTGLRHRLSTLELNAQWSYNLDAEENEDEWSYTLGVLCGQPGTLQLGFQITPDNDGDILGVSIRQAY